MACFTDGESRSACAGGAHEAAGGHSSFRHRGGLDSRGPCPDGAENSENRDIGPRADQLGTGAAAWIAGARLRRGPERYYRVALRRWSPGAPAGTRRRAAPPEDGHYRLGDDPSRPGGAAGRPGHSDRHDQYVRPDWKRPRGQPVASGREHHRRDDALDGRGRKASRVTEGGLSRTEAGGGPGLWAPFTH